MDNIRQYSQYQIILFIFLITLSLVLLYPNSYAQNYVVIVEGLSTEEKDEILLSQESQIATDEDHDKTTFFLPNISKQLDFFNKVKKRFPQYQSSLNMQSQAPSYWSEFGINPLKLGLDLRGGVHFVLEVNLQEANQSFMDEQLFLLTQQLQELAVEYSLDKSGKDQIFIDLQNKIDTQRVYAHLSRRLNEVSFQKIDAYRIKMTISEQVLAQRYEQILDTSLMTMSGRINELGLSEATLYRQGRDQIVIDLPGIQDVHEAKSLLGKTANVEFYLAYTQHWRPGDKLPFGSLVKKDHNGTKYPLALRPILTGASIIDAQVGSTQDGRPAVDLRISHDVMRKFKLITREHKGWAMGVVFREVNHQEIWNEEKGEFDINPVVDEKVISFATIMSELGERFQISGLTYEKSAELAMLLRSGSLPTSVKIVEEKTIGPSLGQENIEQGLQALLFGSAAIFIFMIYFYKTLGFIACLTLICNFGFLLALLSLLQATLTLPGIAGIVLTIGMAVDANVLIFERIREELVKNNNSWAAINLGFDRAMLTIFDSNLTTFIVGLLLLTLGSGVVRGFAVTLTLGLLTSVYSALVGTKVFIKLFYQRHASPQISFKQIFHTHSGGDSDLV